jgi:hypothetical protein
MKQKFSEFTSNQFASKHDSFFWEILGSTAIDEIIDRLARADIQQKSVMLHYIINGLENKIIKLDEKTYQNLQTEIDNLKLNHKNKWSGSLDRRLKKILQAEQLHYEKNIAGKLVNNNQFDIEYDYKLYAVNFAIDKYIFGLDRTELDIEKLNQDLYLIDKLNNLDGDCLSQGVRSEFIKDLGFKLTSIKNKRELPCYEPAFYIEESYNKIDLPLAIPVKIDTESGLDINVDSEANFYDVSRYNSFNNKKVYQLILDLKSFKISESEKSLLLKSLVNFYKELLIKSEPLSQLKIDTLNLINHLKFAL